jgi:hypothetical protein
MPHRSKVLQLRRQHPAADELASRIAITVRTQLSLLQGYADIMEGLSPQLKKQILRVMAEKTRELGSTLQPFVEAPQRHDRRSGITVASGSGPAN